jgi:hypothetical protein
MKTTLNIDGRVMVEFKREAARQGHAMSEMFESALRLLLRSQRKREKIDALPTFHSGGALVDIADRDALYIGRWKAASARSRAGDAGRGIGMPAPRPDFSCG